MAYKTKYIPGEYNVICDICGFKVKSSQTRLDRRQWSPTKGLRICLNDWDEVSPSLGPPPKIPDEMRPVQEARPDVITGNETFTDSADFKFGWEDVSYTNWEAWGILGLREQWENIDNWPSAFYPDADDVVD